MKYLSLSSLNKNPSADCFTFAGIVIKKKDDVVIETRRHNENESGGFPQIVKADMLFAYFRFLQQTSASWHFFQVRFIH